MGRPRATTAARAHTTRALLLRRVSYGESDLVVTLFTESLGRISALARGARRSQKRFGGALEPMHTLVVRVDERAGAELLALREASLDKPRHQLVRDLDRMQAAGRALGWIRRAAPTRTPEPEVWHHHQRAARSPRRRTRRARAAAAPRRARPTPAGRGRLGARSGTLRALRTRVRAGAPGHGRCGARRARVSCLRRGARTARRSGPRTAGTRRSSTAAGAFGRGRGRCTGPG